MYVLSSLVWSESTAGPLASRLILWSQGDVEARGSPSQKAWRERPIGPRGAGSAPQSRALTKGSGFIYRLCFDSRQVLSMSDAMTGLNWILWSSSSRAGGGQIKRHKSVCLKERFQNFCMPKCTMRDALLKNFLEKAFNLSLKQRSDHPQRFNNVFTYNINIIKHYY